MGSSFLTGGERVFDRAGDRFRYWAGFSLASDFCIFFGRLSSDEDEELEESLELESTEAEVPDYLEPDEPEEDDEEDDEEEEDEDDEDDEDEDEDDDRDRFRFLGPACCST